MSPFPSQACWPCTSQDAPRKEYYQQLPAHPQSTMNLCATALIDNQAHATRGALSLTCHGQHIHKLMRAQLATAIGIIVLEHVPACRARPRKHDVHVHVQGCMQAQEGVLQEPGLATRAPCSIACCAKKRSWTFWLGHQRMSAKMSVDMWGSSVGKQAMAGLGLT